MNLQITFDLTKPEMRTLWFECHGNPVEFMRRASMLLCSPRSYSPNWPKPHDLAGFNTPDHAELYARAALVATEPCK